MDKTKAVIEYLMQCPVIYNNPLFFNFAEAKDSNKQLLPVATDKSLNKPYIDGSVDKRYTFTIIDYRSIIYQEIVKIEGFPNENVQEMLDVQSIIDWVSTQNDLRNFPNFGEDCEIEEIKAVTETPNLNGVTSDATPAVAKYSVSIQIFYLDKSKVLWK